MSAVGPGQHPHAFWWGAGAALTLHALVAVGLGLLPAQGWQAERVISVEIDVAPPPPPPPEPSPPEPPPPPPGRQPILRQHLQRLPPPPPMPNQEVKPAATDEDAQPVFGVTQDSVVAGESPVAVPVGNTLMTKDRTLAKVPPTPLPPAASPPPAFAPVDEEAVAEWPKKQFEPKVDYPELAQRMGIAGKVRLRIGIDRRGNVHSVRVLQKAGYGLDEAAVKAIWPLKFTPAKRADGAAVDFVLTYDFTFTPPAQ